LDPKFIVCDEPVSSLDVSIQAQIINLLKDLKEKLNLSYLFIAHDLSVVNYISDDIAVAYLGEIVELSSVENIPEPDPDHRKQKKTLSGDVSLAFSAGCRFYTRCEFKKESCLKKTPPLREVKKGHWVACSLY
jgi:oligopeptide/dipeptide ABC transporter ATP-binding protein